MTAAGAAQAATHVDEKTSTPTQPSAPILPSWFLENCVKTSAELKDSDIPLVVRETQFSDLPEDSQAAYTRRNAKKFEVESVIYDALRDVLYDAEARPTTARTFRKDAVFMKFPSRQEEPGCDPFLQAVVESFTRDIGADLVTITAEDLKDLAQHWASRNYGLSKILSYNEYMDLFVAGGGTGSESDWDECSSHGGSTSPPTRSTRTPSDASGSADESERVRKVRFRHRDDDENIDDKPKCRETEHKANVGLKRSNSTASAASGASNLTEDARTRQGFPFSELVHAAYRKQHGIDSQNVGDTAPLVIHIPRIHQFKPFLESSKRRPTRSRSRSVSSRAYSGEYGSRSRSRSRFSGPYYEGYDSSGDSGSNSSRELPQRTDRLSEKSALATAVAAIENDVRSRQRGLRRLNEIRREKRRARHAGVSSADTGLVEYGMDPILLPRTYQFPPQSPPQALDPYSPVPGIYFPPPASVSHGPYYPSTNYFPPPPKTAIEDGERTDPEPDPGARTLPVTFTTSTSPDNDAQVADRAEQANVALEPVVSTHSSHLQELSTSEEPISAEDKTLKLSASPSLEPHNSENHSSGIPSREGEKGTGEVPTLLQLTDLRTTINSYNNHRPYNPADHTSERDNNVRADLTQHSLTSPAVGVAPTANLPAAPLSHAITGPSPYTSSSAYSNEGSYSFSGPNQVAKKMAEPYTYPGVKPNAGSYPNHSHEAAAASASEDNFHDSLRKGPILEKNESNKSPTTCLYMALERLIRSMAARSTQSGNILLITSSSQMPEKPDFERNALSEFEEQLFHSTIDVVPVRTRAQKELLTDVVHYQFEVSNSRALIRDLKQRSLKHFNVSVLEPYARWPSMKLFSGCKRLFEDQLSTKDLRKAGRLLTEKFDGDLDERRLSKAIHDIYHPEEMAKRRGMLLREWNKSTGYYRGSYRYRDSDDDSEPAHGKWSNFSPKIQALLQELEKNEGLYHWENSFIDCLVDPESVAEGWDDVELDKDVQDTISQITRQVTNRQHAYGVLKTSRIGGVLLYGPPGTGKTLMARVLARESGAVTICVSAAEIESKWIGESEKAIKGLFSLGQKLAPSIIFIDEVDSMFGRREGTDSYSRGRVNQFLTAMDGIVKCENPPFVLVASNLPHRLDPAILRRVPSRLYLRLPPAEARKGLFKIFLRGENLHPEVDFDKLADATKAFSGSDIQTMCVQAALVCEASTAGLDEDGVRLLTQEHFRVAAKRCAPTVSRTAMLHIKAFAKEFDPIGWQKMQADKASAEAGVAKESPATQSRTSGDALTPKTIPTVPVRRPVYISKPIGRNQIRLLSLANSAAAREPENLPQFSMETVGLDDLTPDYQAFAKDRHLEQPKEQIKAWFHQMIEGASGNPPSSESEELETLIVRIPLIKPRFTWGDYICLSYVWGDEQERECITLDGQVFSVTKNLYMALQRWIKTPEVLRHGLKLWVDAISINQADLSERAQEVLRIGEIYSSALCVRAWIGQLTPELAPHLPTVRAWLDNSSSDRGSGRTSVPNSRVQQALWTLLTSLSSEKYWKRVWIMQEISLASSLVFWFGEWSFTTWEILNLPTVLNIQNPFSFPESSSLKLVGDRMQLLRKAFPNLVRLTRLRSYNASKGFDIVDTIFLAQSAEATDHRDKVFGVLSLFPQEIAMQIQPNYDSAYTSADTYIMFSKICLQQQGGLDRLAHWANRYRPHSSLPSWTFDLNAPSTAIDTSYELMTVLGVENNSQPLRSFSTIPAFQDSDKIMVCTGKFVDTVRSITADYSCNMREDETDTDMENTIPLEMEEESGPPCLPDEYEARLYNDLVPMSSKLSLARVLSMNPDYEFDHGPSMLDVPWNLPDLIKSAATDIDAMQTDDLSELTLDDARRLFDLNDIDTQTSNAGFAPIIDRARWYHIFTSVLHANATFNCHGISLQDYFSTAQELDSKVNQAMIDGEISYGALGPCRLFTTREGRLGLGPKFMELGDRVAMLSSCDTPVVLREKGMFFEFVGGCFVDGLMKGKAVRDLEDGKLMMEIIKIC